MPESPQIALIRRLSYILDSAIPIPGTKFRIGIDPIIGLIPGVGDAVTSLVSTYIIYAAMQMRVSRFTLVRMVFNILIESVIGIVPVVGDIFDAYWKSNERNRILLEKNLANPSATSVDKLFVLGVVAITLAIVVGTAFTAIILLKALVAHF